MKQDPIQDRLRQFESLCRQRGQPVTVQRRYILEAVLTRADHPTADQVYESAKDRVPGLSRTTVYRVLDVLVGLGVIRRLHHPGANARFDGRISRHHHLICKKCQRVVDVESRNLDDLELPPNQRHDFRIEDYSVHFLGVCAECDREAAQ